MYAESILFVGFLAGALVIHGRNQKSLTGAPSPRAIAWAQCSRQLCVAAVWVAVAIGASMISQGLSLIPALGGPMHSNPSDNMLAIIYIARFAESATLFASIVIALTAVSRLVPKFSMDVLVSTEPSDAEPAKDNK